MTSSIESTTPPTDATASRGSDHTTGILPSQALRRAIHEGVVQAREPIAESLIQPSSLDLRLGSIAYRVQASFLPGTQHTVADKIADFAMHRLDLTAGAVLEKGCVYIVPLMESLKLPEHLSAIANPKSSTGRLDVFARLISDRSMEFDRISHAYNGPLYAEISPRTFSILARAGDRLMQLRLRCGSAQFSDEELRQLHARVGLVDLAPGQETIRDGLALTVNVSRRDDSDLIGYKARPYTGLIDLQKIRYYDPADFWEPLIARPNKCLVLGPDDFYILSSREAVTVPPDHAAEMLAYDTLVGEFRVHYAGFFDPGFGYAEAGGQGSRAVLEVRSHDVPFVIEDGQIIGRLHYERLTEPPDKIYGETIGSFYQSQGLALSKHFKI